MFYFAIISLKKHNLAKSHKLRPQISNGNGVLGAERPQRLAIFENLLLK